MAVDEYHVGGPRRSGRVANAVVQPTLLQAASDTFEVKMMLIYTSCMSRAIRESPGAVSIAPSREDEVFSQWPESPSLSRRCVWSRAVQL